MVKPKTVQDVLSTRRDLLKYGGLGLAGASIEGLWPPKVRAAEIGSKVRPRGNAKNVIFYEISGAISHLDTFDFKDNPAVPKDFDVRKISTGIYFPVNFLPRIEKITPRVAMMRSFVTHEEVHLRGQYYVQAGKQLNVAFAPSSPTNWHRAAANRTPSLLTSLSTSRPTRSGRSPRVSFRRNIRCSI